MTKVWTCIKIESKHSSLHLYVVLLGADRTTTVTTINRDIHRAKTSNDIYTICSFLEKHSDALVSAHDIRSFTNIATDRKN